MIIKIIIGVFVFVGLLSLYNKVIEIRERNKMLSDIKTQLDKHKRPETPTFPKDGYIR